MQLICGAVLCSALLSEATRLSDKSLLDRMQGTSQRLQGQIGEFSVAALYTSILRQIATALWTLRARMSPRRSRKRNGQRAQKL